MNKLWWASHENSERKGGRGESPEPFARSRSSFSQSIATVANDPRTLSMLKYEAEGHLTAPQLCDLLNYVLGLPEIWGRSTIIRKPIDPVVVASWCAKATRLSAESWCEAQLTKAGVLPQKKGVGRIRGRQIPPELMRWLDPTNHARILRRAA